jgi:hypothetical protein
VIARELMEEIDRRGDALAQRAPLAAHPATTPACQHPMRIHNYTTPTGWEEGVCGEPMPCAIHGSPSRESGALLREYGEAVGMRAIRVTPESYAREEKAREALVARLSTLERDAARMREAEAALASIGIRRNVEHPDESDWITVTEPHGEEPANSLRDALDTILRAVENDTTFTPRRFDQVPDGCWVACIAGLTDIPHEALAALVPVGVTDGFKSPEYHNGVNRLMRSSGWRLTYIGPDVPRGFAIGSGTSPRGHHHAVIVLDGKLWHDPHPSRAGIPEFESYEVVIPLVDSPAMRTALTPSGETSE